MPKSMLFGEPELRRRFHYPFCVRQSNGIEFDRWAWMWVAEAARTTLTKRGRNFVVCRHRCRAQSFCVHRKCGTIKEHVKFKHKHSALKLTSLPSPPLSFNLINSWKRAQNHQPLGFQWMNGMEAHWKLCINCNCRRGIPWMTNEWVYKYAPVLMYDSDGVL